VPEEPSSQRRGAFLAFWTTLPGILTGVAALITAVVGAIGLWKSQSGGGSSPAPTQAVTAGAATEPSGSQSGDSGAVRGRLSLVRGDSADLERGQIGSSATADVIFGPETTPNLFAAGSAFLAPVEAQPGKRSCAAALSTRHDAFEVVPELGTNWICVSTSEGNVAVVRILSSPGVGRAKLVLDYTVWR
jgi:hypothetical protein